jgi:aspartate/methionine/tyrosine aminotransferase
MRLSTKWNKFETSIFSVMTQKAIAAGAVNLAQGFPDFDGPDVIKKAAIDAIMGSLNQYAPAPGLPVLRQKIAAFQKDTKSLSYNPDTEVTVFTGATEAIFCTMQALLDPGDEIIAFEPFYDSYPASAYAAGAKLVGVPLSAPTWSFSESELAAKITTKTRAIIVNTPHNPTGKVFTHDELKVIADLAKKHDLLVFTDEVYEQLVYGSAKHVSLAAFPGMAERTITISSTSKTFSMTGWKVGYAFASPEITKLLRSVHQFTVFCTATPLQAGMIKAFELDKSYYEELRKDYLAKRNLLVKILHKNSFKCLPPDGSYFIVADYSAVSSKNDLDFANWLTETIKVATIPTSVFYNKPAEVREKQRYVRFAFCKGEATLLEAGKKLEALGRA